MAFTFCKILKKLQFQKTGVRIIPVRAFRIEPVRPIGYMSLDAESVPFGSSQGQILPGKGRIYVSDQRP